MSAPSSRELAQRLYDKNIELDNRRRKSAQVRVPSDPNSWQQMRENYEAIIVEDHAFAEQHNIEYALWQLHYRRIEEFRAHFNAALASAGSTTSQGGKGPRPDRINKIRMQFKTFLSEATGFYHDFILKIRARYGLPLGNFSEASENQIVMGKDAKKSAEMRKGLISCHRCLIYLGDLARYKGLYGEGDSKSRDYAAASSYYLQAASLWPSSGNPHHQLAILATYSGDELVAVYRYFRSLAVDNPFSTARDNLIVAFEKNRQSYSQFNGDTEASIKESPAQMDPKGRAKVEATARPKEANSDASSAVGKAASMDVTYKSFCNRFVRLNGIIFTRTSLEMFEEVLSLVSSALRELLTSGPVEKLNLGADVVENGLVIVRLVCILIFTVHTANREAECQTYADIVQRTVLLRDALTAVFELMGLILERCSQLSDPSSSYLLPGILVFLEWLACCPDVAIGRDLGDKEGSVMSKFWNFCISLLNELVSTNLVLIDDEDETCFANMSRYEEGESENRLALWEDFELRGFSPLQAAQTILDFSRMHSFENEGNKEKISRVKRIIAAGKALASVVKVDQKTVSFDSKLKKFVIDAEHQMLDDILPTFSLSDPIVTNRVQQKSANLTGNLAVMQPKPQLYFEGEEEDEVIVFKPTTVDKGIDATSSRWTPHDGLEPGGNTSVDVPQVFFSGVSAPHFDVLQQTALPSSGINHVFQNLPSHQPHSPMWLLDQQSALANGMKGLTLMENGHVMKPGIQDAGLVRTASILLPMQNSASISSNFTLYSQGEASGAVVQPKINATAFTGHAKMTPDGELVACTGISPLTVAVNTSSALPAGPRKKNPVKRPPRHNGPPPGFSPLPPKQVNDSIFESDLMGKNPLMDDYKWLDDYEPTLPINGLGPHQSLNLPLQSGLQHISNSNGSLLMNKFPFPGKQVPILQYEVDLQKVWQDHHTECVLLKNEQLQQQQFIKEGQQSLPFEYQPESICTNQRNV